MKNKTNLVGFGLLALGAFLTIGTVWLFPTCGPMESGAWMKCHWSGQVVVGIGIVLAVLAAAYLLIPSPPLRAGLSLAIIPIGLFNIATLNHLIGLCGKAEMQCRAVTQPAVTIISAAVILLGAANTVWLLRSERRKKTEVL